ncbi:LuxR C-terminal-related transcriptional regulator [Rufibacter sediminis]|uniref:PAS domain-containing protein n=1 Tax=Rufibacter sediminis TaxID=2762756 RepID=A0ABR6VWN9_9BACT|nr:LuxR C-terminal-related transcriptional regulator [Rufibacter sediminis]MBC3541624.1 PAS domain-containing protein [Rufibacter sediminis]
MEETRNRTAEETELSMKLKALEEKCAFLERIIHEVPANIYVSDLEEGVIWCNKTNEETLGFTLEEIRNMGGLEYLRQIVHPEDLHIPDDSISHYQEFTGAEFGGVFRAKHKARKEYNWFIGWAKAFLHRKEGQVKQILCVDVDMSPRMNTEKQLIAALQENLKHKNQLLLKTLSKRETEILTWVCRGYSSKAIAEKLFLSIHTVNTHRRNIQNRLGTSNVADLVVLAKEAGLG